MLAQCFLPTCPTLPPAGSKQRRPLCSPVHSALWWCHWHRAQSQTPPLRGHLEGLWGHMTSLIHCTPCIARREICQTRLSKVSHYKFRRTNCLTLCSSKERKNILFYLLLLAQAAPLIREHPDINLLLSFKSPSLHLQDTGASDSFTTPTYKN